MEGVKGTLIVALLVLALSWASIPSANADGQLWAVVVGVEGGDADHPDDDAQDFVDVLTAIHGYPRGNIKLLMNGEATKAVVMDALEWLRIQEGSGDGVSIFFSCHGSEDRLHLYRSVLWDSELSSILLEFESRNILLVIDACHSGSFLDVADAIPSGIVITACGADEVTYDIGFFENTIFAEYFVDRGLSQGLADENGDGAVSVEEAFNYAYEKCVDPPGALSPTHPQMVNKYGEEYLLNSPVHSSSVDVIRAAKTMGKGDAELLHDSWFNGSIIAVAVIAFSYRICRKKVNVPSLID